jgi:hypothetical protein
MSKSYKFKSKQIIKRLTKMLIKILLFIVHKKFRMVSKHYDLLDFKAPITRSECREFNIVLKESLKNMNVEMTSKAALCNLI